MERKRGGGSEGKKRGKDDITRGGKQGERGCSSEGKDRREET